MFRLLPPMFRLLPPVFRLFPLAVPPLLALLLFHPFLHPGRGLLALVVDHAQLVLGSPQVLLLLHLRGGPGCLPRARVRVVAADGGARSPVPIQGQKVRPRCDLAARVVPPHALRQVVRNKYPDPGQQRERDEREGHEVRSRQKGREGRSGLRHHAADPLELRGAHERARGGPQRGFPPQVRREPPGHHSQLLKVPPSPVLALVLAQKPPQHVAARRQRGQRGRTPRHRRRRRRRGGARALPLLLLIGNRSIFGLSVRGGLLTKTSSSSEFMHSSDHLGGRPREREGERRARERAGDGGSGGLLGRRLGRDRPFVFRRLVSFVCPTESILVGELGLAWRGCQESFRGGF